MSEERTIGRYKTPCRVCKIEVWTPKEPKDICCACECKLLLEKRTASLASLVHECETLLDHAKKVQEMYQDA